MNFDSSTLVKFEELRTKVAMQACGRKRTTGHIFLFKIKLYRHSYSQHLNWNTVNNVRIS